MSKESYPKTQTRHDLLFPAENIEDEPHAYVLNDRSATVSFEHDEEALRYRHLSNAERLWVNSTPYDKRKMKDAVKGCGFCAETDKKNETDEK